MQEKLMCSEKDEYIAWLECHQRVVYSFYKLVCREVNMSALFKLSFIMEADIYVTQRGVPKSVVKFALEV